jgi:uncharacterized protein YecT (DUF1311 family)
MSRPFDNGIPNKRPLWLLYLNHAFGLGRLPALSRTFVAIVILFAGLLSGFLAPLHAQADQNECSNYGSSIEYAQCLSSKLTELRGQLDRSYRRALETVPNRSPAPSDNRQTTQQLRQHLVQSQAAWQTYVAEICAYAGGVQGGSSIWVTIFQVQCLLKETRSRIEYLEHLPTGG